MALARQQLSKEVPEATDTHAAMEALFYVVFYMWPMP
jgi:hypothetical protein